MNRVERSIIAGSLTVAAALGILASREMRQTGATPSNHASLFRAPSRAPASLPLPSTPRPSSTPALQANRDRFHEDFFHRDLLGIPVVRDLYDTLRAKLPPGELSDLVALYVSEGPVRTGGPDFARFMDSLHREVRARSGELARFLTDQDAVLKGDAFTYQMTLNLIFQLDVPPATKAELLGSAMAIRFSKDPDGEVTMMSANITNAFILMKNSGVTLEQAAPYIRKGLVANFNDPEAVREFIARANAYYPGAI